MSVLLSKQQQFSAAAARLILQAISMGYGVTLGETFRTEEQAERYAARHIGIKNSLHCQRLAIDLQLFKGDKYLTRTEDYQPLGEWWERQHPDARWGGRFKDGNHFSFAHGGRK